MTIDLSSPDGHLWQGNKH